jgi:Stigma-specific protein, Stig1
MSPSSLLRAVPLLCLGALLAGCPETGIVCRNETTRCGQGCADLRADGRNCGACGVACQTGQVCQPRGDDPSLGECVCQAGATNCNGQCVVLATDPNNCGVCGKACATDELCELQLSDAGTAGASVCVKDCSVGTQVRCGNSCINLQTDSNHCGACGAACTDSQSCHAGKCTYDLVAACFSSGQVRGLQATSSFVGPLEAMGTAPQSLAAYGEALLAVDGLDRRLYQARLRSTGGAAFAPIGYSNRVGSVPNQVLVEAPYVYVINSSSGTLQVLKKDAPDTATADGGSDPLVVDGGSVAGGVRLATVAELSFGANTFPQAGVKVGNALWVPLYGGFGTAGAAAGQTVKKVDLTNPEAPAVVDTVDLSGLDLKAFDGGAPVARPYSITASGNQLLVALNNLNPDTYVPEGPGLLAKIDATTKAVTVLDLGADKCLNPIWMALQGANVVVACAGNGVYDFVTFSLVSVEKAGVVLVDLAGTRKAVWEASCPADAGLPDGGSSCAPILPSRFAVADNKVWLGDQNGGRLFVLDVAPTALTERRGYSGSAGGPIQACGLDPITGIANVADVLAVP